MVRNPRPIPPTRYVALHPRRVPPFFPSWTALMKEHGVHVFFFPSLRSAVNARPSPPYFSKSRSRQNPAPPEAAFGRSPLPWISPSCLSQRTALNAQLFSLFFFFYLSFLSPIPPSPFSMVASFPSGIETSHSLSSLPGRPGSFLPTLHLILVRRWTVLFHFFFSS